MCGLKQGQFSTLLPRKDVTPFVGVWIETLYPILLYSLENVTPFVGVWIETLSGMYKSETSYSHTLRGCVD